MRRLTDEALDPDSPEGRLVELVRAMPRLERAPFAQERIFARLTHAGTRTRRLPWVACAIALGACASAFAAAAVNHLDVSAPSRALQPASASPFPASTPPAPGATATPEVGGGAEEIPSDKASLRVVAQASPSPRLKLHARSIESRSLAGGEDPAPLLDAIHTLRTSGDPVRAGVLLAEYLKAYPRSPLSEDAMALSIEAAIARHDSRSSAELGRRYVAQFPNGRYRTFASRAVQSIPLSDSP